MMRFAIMCAASLAVYQCALGAGTSAGVSTTSADDITTTSVAINASCPKLGSCNVDGEVETLIQTKVSHQSKGQQLAVTLLTSEPLLSGSKVSLRNPSHGNEYVECSGHAGGGFGVSTRNKERDASEFVIYKWSGSGKVNSGDQVYLRNPSHGNEYVEAHGRAGAGYGISTRGTKRDAAMFQIYKWSGSGPIGNGDEIYIRSPSHANEYVEASGRAGAGYGISTRGEKIDAAKFIINVKWSPTTTTTTTTTTKCIGDPDLYEYINVGGGQCLDEDGETLPASDPRSIGYAKPAGETPLAACQAQCSKMCNCAAIQYLDNYCWLFAKKEKPYVEANPFAWGHIICYIKKLK